MNTPTIVETKGYQGDGMYKLLRVIIFALAPSFVLAQETGWIQIEAKQSLIQAEERAKIYAQELDDIAAHSLGSGWYAISMGPYPTPQAQAILDMLKSQGALPRDSFVSNGQNYRQTVWTAQSAAADDTPTDDRQDAAAIDIPQPAEDPDDAPAPQLPDETRAQALASEQNLSRDEKRDLQMMLQWAGFYNSTLDGLFGRGTRTSMANWQQANDFDPTGVLTTVQRAELRRQYMAVIADLGLTQINDRQAGISLKLPMERLEFSQYAAPLAHYRSRAQAIEQVFLISMDGDREDLSALYEVLQTLEIVPLDPDASKSRDEFVIRGETADRFVYIQAALADDGIKGFGLVWPSANREQYDRLLSEMANSLIRTAGTLPAQLGQAVDADLDTTFGLALRKPAFIRSGVFVSDTGRLLTLGNDLDQCNRLMIQGEIPATATQQANSNMAVLTPQTPIAPMATAAPAARLPLPGDAVYLASFPFGGVLSAASITLGQVETLMAGPTGGSDLVLSIRAGDTDRGGAVLDRNGNLIGILGQADGSDRILPPNTHIAHPVINDGALADLITFASAQSPASGLADDALVQELSKIASYFECWAD
jgi:peptidoglycan hydrolase-like protein with peptidoglycan-binding domain